MAISAQARDVPVSKETVRIPGLQAPAEIRIDRWGVSHIYARSDSDVFFVQGFNAARDRLFQIDLWRRRGLGRLAEVFGPAFVEQDYAARLFLYRGDMDHEWRIYDSRRSRDAEVVAQRFVAGVNAYIDWLGTQPQRLPWEFRQFDYLPEKWATEDVVRIRSHGLSRNLLSEVARANTLCKAKDVEADQIRLRLSNDWKAQIPDGLDPCLPSEVLNTFQLATQSVRVTAEALKTGQRSQRLAAIEDLSDAEGSNSWVIGPSKSTTGRAILANDPHRAYSVPSLRYIVHLSAPGLDVIGAGEPALPGISLGHNGAIAFGLTIFNIDQEDLYVHTLNPADPMQYRYKNGWAAFQVVPDQIAIAGHGKQSVELLFSRYGPVISINKENRRAFVARSGWLEPGMSPYFASTTYMRAKDFGEFKNALVHWGTPSLNQVYADTKGNIGWIATGLAPKRPNWDGLLPVPGDGRYEWAGFWRGKDLPWAFNPSTGWIATANAYNIPHEYPARERKLGFEWTNPSRHQRVHEVLGALATVSLEDSERLQKDILSIPARRLIALLAPLAASDEKTSRALAFLREWDARLTADSPQAALHEVWQLRHLREAFREAVLKPGAAAAISTTDMDVVLEGLENPGARFGIATAAKRDELLLTTLKAAWQEMESLQGPEPSVWQWGKLHFNLSEHPFASIVDDVQRVRINVGPIAKDGSEHTPSQSVARPSDFRQMNGPSVRIVLDVGNWDNSRAINHPGQSGDPASSHYRDLAPLWRDGKYFPLLYSREAVVRATEHVIQLIPQ